MELSQDFIDVEPMLIELENAKWVHPFIADWYCPDDFGYDSNIYRVYFKNNEDKTCRVYFKSTYLNDKNAAFFAQKDWEDKNLQNIFKHPYIDPDEVYIAIKLTLLEDFWGPTPHKEPFKELNNDAVKWFKENPSNQFCFSKFGNKINKFFKNDANVNLFSLDCGLTTDGKEWWCDS
jgi:hypothetical protein